MAFYDNWFKKGSSVGSEDVNVSGNAYLMAISKFLGDNFRVYSRENRQLYIDEGYSKNVDLFAPISYVGDKSAEVRIKVMMRDDKGKDIEVFDYPDELKQILAQPNPITTWGDYMTQQTSFNLIDGNNYTYGIRAGDNRPYTQLWTMAPVDVTIVTGNFSDGLIKGYEVGGFIQNDLIEPEKVLHCKTFNPNHRNLEFLYGQSPIKAALTTLQRSNESYLTSQKMLQNMGAHGAFVGAGREAATSPQIKEARKKYRKDYGGAENANGIMFIQGGGEMKYHNFGLSPSDMDLFKGQGFDLERFCNIIKVPAVLFNSGETTFQNQTEAKKTAWNDAILPPVNKLINGLNSWLMPAYSKIYKKDIRLVVDTSHIPELQADKKEQVEWVTPLTDRGFLTGNQALEIMGQPQSTDPTMDELRIYDTTGRTLPIEEANKPPVVPPPAPTNG